MKVLDLFSGIGGFSLGLERSGMQTVAFCENDKKCKLVLKKHWPDIPIHDDIKKLSGNQFEAGAIDLICGGFPCQPFSVAGKQRGDKDDRHLWPEMFRLIQEIRPNWVIGENVAGLINMGLDQVLSDLESADYSTETLIIPACAVNAPHRRDRGWIVGYSASQRGRNSTQLQRRMDGDLLEVGKRKEMPDEIKGSGKNVDYSKSIGIQGSWSVGKQESPIHVEQAIPWSNGSRIRENHWSIEPNVGRVANGVPRRVDRLKQLGNAVVPQIPEIIGRAIMEIKNRMNK